MGLIHWYRSRRLWVKILLPVLLLLLAAVVVLGVKIWQVYTHTRQMVEVMQETGEIGVIDTEVVVETVPEYQGDYLNLLVVGIDYDEGDELRDYGSVDAANTDLILYIHYDIKQNTISALQIPRDSYVGDITRNLRINRVLAEGENRQNPISNLATYINQAFGLPVDKYVALDMGAFKEIVDVMGGIEIYLPCDIYVYSETGEKIKMASEGYTRMNGSDIEVVVRARKQFGQQDLERLMLQRYVYASMYRMLKGATMSDIYRHILPIVSYRVKSDMDFSTMYSLCSHLLQLESSNIYFVRVPGGPVTVEGQSLYGVDAAALVPILNQHFLTEGMQPIAAENLTIPTGFDYPLGEVLDAGGYLSDQLADYDNAQSQAAD